MAAVSTACGHVAEVKTACEKAVAQWVRIHGIALTSRTGGHGQLRRWRGRGRRDKAG